MQTNADSGSMQFRYAGFISYSQKDQKWAKRIHRALEAYRLPTGLPPELVQNKRLGRFFRDDDELAGAPSLSDALESSLDSSAALVVVCSPNSARSKWVDAEIRRFKSRGPSARVLAVIVDGKPDSPDPEVMCFPPSLLCRVDVNGELTDVPDEPLAPDANKEPFNRLITRLVAGLLGLEFDTLWQREQRRRRRQRLIIGAAATVSAIGIAIGSMMYLDAERERKLAESEQLRTESINLATTAQQAMDENRVDDALIAALDALPASLANPGRPLTPHAMAALQRVMAGNYNAGIVARFKQSIQEMHLLPDGRLAVWLDDFRVRVINVQNGTVEWESPEDSRLSWLDDSGLAVTTFSDESLDSEGKIQVEHRVSVVELTTGTTVRQLTSEDHQWWVGPYAVVSPSANRMLVTRSVSVAEHELYDLAVWQLPKPGDSNAPVVLGQVDGPSLGEYQKLDATFIDDEKLLLSWGHPRRSVALWRIGEPQLRNLSTADEAFGCDGQQLDSTEEKRDSVSLSDNRRLISHARPVRDGGWCVQMWNAETTEPLPAFRLGKRNVGKIEALSTDRIITSRRSFSSAALWLPHDSAEPQEHYEETLFKCDASREGNSQHPLAIDEHRWLIDRSGGFSACSDDNVLHLYRGGSFNEHHTLHGHQGDVTTLVYDQGNARLYSGGKDGEIRAWNFSQLPRTLALGGEILSLTQGTNTVGIVYRDSEANFYARVYSHDGEPVSPPLPFAVRRGALDEELEANLTRKLMFLHGGKTIALIEVNICHFNCDPNTTRMLTLYRVADGKQLAQIDKLYSGDYFSHVPVSHALSAEGDRLALPQRGGTVVEYDTASGEPVREHSIEGWNVSDVSYLNGALWILASSNEDDPGKREMALYRVEGDGGYTQLWKQRAQSAELYTPPAGHTMLIEYSLAHLQQGLRTRFVMLGMDGTARPLTMPESYREQNDSLDSAYFYANGTRLLMFFSEWGPAPLDLDLQSGEASIFKATIPASMSDGWRIDDPLGRTVGSVDKYALSLLPLTGQQPLCPELNGRKADAAAFSPDGRLLAVAKSYDDSFSVYDTASCSLTYSGAFGVSGNNELGFVDNSTIWTVSDDGQLRLVKLADDFNALHRQALQLRHDLGL